MGYYTQYKLKVQLLEQNNDTDNITIDSVIKQLSNANAVDKEELLRNLEALKNGGEITVTDLYIIAKLREINESARHALTKNGGTSDSSKWYDHETELREFSKNYPKWLFTLEGKGEEAEDLWIKYFFNGKMQEAQAVITFEEFNPSKLK